MELAASRLDNDTRGWIMAIVSGVACVFGASIICVDVFVRLLPGKRNFRIQDSNIFLACSLSLSFGVMLFSSLFSMLPESKEYLKEEGWADQPAGFVMMACFVGGFFGIQAVSRLLHQYMPSHVVDCDHSHGEADAQPDDGHAPRRPSRVSRAGRRPSRPHSARRAKDGSRPENGSARLSETTPLLAPGRDAAAAAAAAADFPSKGHVSLGAEAMAERPASPLAASRGRATTLAGDAAGLGRRPSMYHVQRRVMSFVKDTKCNCDEEGMCYGYTDPCGQECFKHLSKRSSHGARLPTTLRTTTGVLYSPAGAAVTGGHDAARADGVEPLSPMFRTSRAASREPLAAAAGDVGDDECRHHEHGQCRHDGYNGCDDDDDDDDEYDDDDDDDDTHVHAHAHADVDDGHACASPDAADAADAEAQHHHHVPTNAFLSLGLQTSIAIALHKFPEGFIAYATNHANPGLGLNVFMALLVHNVSEGFALALPLYMALGSRWRALLWAALLGGLAQPLGAAAAALWFRLARGAGLAAPGAVAYACLFAATAGIMVGVALQLFVESLSLNHDRNLSIFCGFLGMVLMGLSSALFAAH